MDEMKSALERAMERADSLGKPTEEDVRRWKYEPEGVKLASRCLEEDCYIPSEIENYDDDVRKYVVKAAEDVLIKNIDLPRNEHAKRVSKKAMEAIKDLKQDKVALENIYTQLRRVFTHYEQEGEQQRKQAYDTVKRDVEAKMRQAIQRQPALASNPNLEAEVEQQFQQELRRAFSQLETQYIKVLEDCKTQIASLK